MKTIKNKFGEGIIYDESDLKGAIYAECTACMSIHSEFASWASAHEDRMTQHPLLADTIIVLSCQVTDLAVLNDLRTLEILHETYPLRDFYIGGCLANRFDILLPDYVRRLGPVRTDYQPIKTDRQLINFAAPFWVKNFDEDNQDPLSEGHLFRHCYPLRIGVGCDKTCAYCTIRHTRGEAYRLDIAQLEKEFVEHDNVVLIADSPTSSQITGWALLAIKHGKPLSIRNLEPMVAVHCWSILLELAQKGLLKILHCPIQSDSVVTLTAMKRPVLPTLEFIKKVPELQKLGVVCATNVIVDYQDKPNPSKAVYELFDYVSENPYWNGKWDRKLAEERYAKYIG